MPFPYKNINYVSAPQFSIFAYGSRVMFTASELPADYQVCVHKQMAFICADPKSKEHTILPVSGVIVPTVSLQFIDPVRYLDSDFSQIEDGQKQLCPNILVSCTAYISSKNPKRGYWISDEYLQDYRAANGNCDFREMIDEEMSYVNVNGYKACTEIHAFGSFLRHWE